MPSTDGTTSVGAGVRQLLGRLRGLLAASIANQLTSVHAATVGQDDVASRALVTLSSLGVLDPGFDRFELVLWLQARVRAACGTVPFKPEVQQILESVMDPGASPDAAAVLKAVLRDSRFSRLKAQVTAAVGEEVEALAADVRGGRRLTDVLGAWGDEGVAEAPPPPRRPDSEVLFDASASADDFLAMGAPAYDRLKPLAADLRMDKSVAERRAAIDGLVQYAPGDMLHSAFWMEVQVSLVEAVGDPVPHIREAAVAYVRRLFKDASTLSPVQSGELCTTLARFLLSHGSCVSQPSTSTAIDAADAAAAPLLEAFSLLHHMLVSVPQQLVYLPDAVFDLLLLSVLALVRAPPPPTAVAPPVLGVFHDAHGGWGVTPAALLAHVSADREGAHWFRLWMLHVRPREQLARYAFQTGVLMDALRDAVLPEALAVLQASGGDGAPPTSVHAFQAATYQQALQIAAAVLQFAEGRAYLPVVVPPADRAPRPSVPQLLAIAAADTVNDRGSNNRVRDLPSVADGVVAVSDAQAHKLRDAGDGSAVVDALAVVAAFVEAAVLPGMQPEVAGRLGPRFGAVHRLACSALVHTATTGQTGPTSALLSDAVMGRLVAPLQTALGSAAPPPPALGAAVATVGAVLQEVCRTSAGQLEFMLGPPPAAAEDHPPLWEVVGCSPRPAFLTTTQFATRAVAMLSAGAPPSAPRASAGGLVVSPLHVSRGRAGDAAPPLAPMAVHAVTPAILAVASLLQSPAGLSMAAALPFVDAVCACAAGGGEHAPLALQVLATIAAGSPQGLHLATRRGLAGALAAHVAAAYVAGAETGGVPRRQDALATTRLCCSHDASGFVLDGAVVDLLLFRLQQLFEADTLALALASPLGNFHFLLHCLGPLQAILHTPHAVPLLLAGGATATLSRLGRFVFTAGLLPGASHAGVLRWEEAHELALRLLTCMTATLDGACLLEDTHHVSDALLALTAGSSAAVTPHTLARMQVFLRVRTMGGSLERRLPPLLPVADLPRGLPTIPTSPAGVLAWAAPRAATPHPDGSKPPFGPRLMALSASAASLRSPLAHVEWLGELRSTFLSHLEGLHVAPTAAFGQAEPVVMRRPRTGDGSPSTPPKPSSAAAVLGHDCVEHVGEEGSCLALYAGMVQAVATAVDGATALVRRESSEVSTIHLPDASPVAGVDVAAAALLRWYGGTLSGLYGVRELEDFGEAFEDVNLQVAGMDWFAAVVGLLCGEAGPMASLANGLMPGSGSPFAGLAAEAPGLAPLPCGIRMATASPQARSRVCHLVEAVLGHEAPTVVAAFSRAGVCTQQVVSAWLSQCFLNTLNFPDVARYVLLCLLGGVDYQVYFTVGVLQAWAGRVFRAVGTCTLLEELLLLPAPPLNWRGLVAAMLGMERRHREFVVGELGLGA